MTASHITLSPAALRAFLDARIAALARSRTRSAHARIEELLAVRNAFLNDTTPRWLERPANVETSARVRDRLRERIRSLTPRAA